MWDKYGYYWQDRDGEHAIVPKEQVGIFLNEALDFDGLDADSIGFYETENKWLMEEAERIDNDYIGFEISVMSSYWMVNMQVLYDAISEGEWDYEKC